MFNLFLLRKAGPKQCPFKINLLKFTEKNLFLKLKLAMLILSVYALFLKVNYEDDVKNKVSLSCAT